MRLTHEELDRIKANHCRINGFYISQRGNIRKGGKNYAFHESCQVCGYSYVSQKGKLGLFCSPCCSNKGENNARYGVRGKDSPLFGMKFPHRSGIDNSNWKGGITPESKLIRNSNDYVEWYKAVFLRDCFICQMCGRQGGNLNAHHMESFNSNKKMRTLISNGITLCEDCHKKFHHQFGYGDNTKEQFEEFLKGGDCN